MNICGLCAKFHKIEGNNCVYLFTQAPEEINTAIFRRCGENGLVHECFVGCDDFVPTKVFYCARFETYVNTGVCLDNQIRKAVEACLDCNQGSIVIETMRGITWSELK